LDLSFETAGCVGGWGKSGLGKGDEMVEPFANGDCWPGSSFAIGELCAGSALATGEGGDEGEVSAVAIVAVVSSTEATSTVRMDIMCEPSC